MVSEPSRTTPVHGEFDVVVVGGGPAGIMAASAAARGGHSTILLERYGFLGGAGTAGGLSTFCGLHARVHGEHRRVIHGLADELLERLGKLDGPAAWAHVPFEKSPATAGMLYPSLMFRINGVDAAAAGEAPWRTVERLMDEAERAGTHTFPRKRPIVRPQRNPLEWRANLTQLSNPDGSAVDGTHVDALTHGELQGRQQVLDAFTFIKDNAPGFGGSYIVDLAPQIGIRETRRIIGRYQLTEDDVLDCADFPDTIGVNGWPVEPFDQWGRFLPEHTRRQPPRPAATPRQRRRHRRRVVPHARSPGTRRCT